MVRFDASKYEFDTPEGGTILLDLFDGRGQLVVYQFMDDGPDKFCPGCTHFATTNRGVDLLLFVNSILDLRPYGRQKDWEDSRPD